MKIEVEYTLTGKMEVEISDNTANPFYMGQQFIYGKKFETLVKNLNSNFIPSVVEVKRIDNEKLV